MQMFFCTKLTLAIICMFVSLATGRSGGTKMSFKAPELDDEAQWSNHVPTTLNCEGCKAISHLMNKMFWEFHKTKHPKNKLKPESEVVDLVENICHMDTFSSYGVKNVNGKTKLSGPGLKAADAAGMIMGGGKWPGRLASRCNELLGEFDDYEVYQMVVKNKGRDFLFDLFCTNKHQRKLNSCGGGLATMLEPSDWENGLGTSYTEEEVGEDNDDDDDGHDEL